MEAGMWCNRCLFNTKCVNGTPQESLFIFPMNKKCIFLVCSRHDVLTHLLQQNCNATCEALNAKGFDLLQAITFAI
jgi:hypothetical protein